MAILKPLLFNKIRKSAGNFTIYELGGQLVLRSKPLSVHNPRSPLQIRQREKFAFLVQLSKLFWPVYQLSFPQRPANHTAYTAFLSVNMGAFDEDTGEFRWDKLSCSSGSLALPEITAHCSGSEITFISGGQTKAPQAYASDLIYAVIYDKAETDLELIELFPRNYKGENRFTLEENYRQENLYVYAFALSANKQKASNTCFLPLQEPEKSE